MVRRRTALIAALIFSALAQPLAAQCANGSAPPCGPLKALPPTPALDERKWIVLPFANTARAADVDWLSAASVDLLSIDMSRWSDHKVVDAASVTDLLSNVPEARRTQLGLQSALEIARRVGAGKLVMGAYLKEGDRTTVTVKIYNVGTPGAAPRVVNQPPSRTDSISAAYRQLVPKVMEVAPPVGTMLTGVGTQSTEALRAYKLGTEAANRWRFDSAAVYFRRAVALDSTFALAQMQHASRLRGFGPDSADRARRAYATATRYAESLPERERILISLQQPGVTETVQCTSASRLLALDSADAEGWRYTGFCFNRKTRFLVPDGGGVRRDASLNAVRRALEHAAELQPGQTIALPLLQNALFRLWQSRGCMAASRAVEAAVNVYGMLVPSTVPCPPESDYWAAGAFEGDSLVLRFERVREFDPPTRRRESLVGRRAMYAAGRDFFARWAAANPRLVSGHTLYAQLLLEAGDLAGADREWTVAIESPDFKFDPNRLAYSSVRSSLDWRLERPERAAILLDSGGPTGHSQTAFAKFSRGAPAAMSATVQGLRTTFYSAFAGVVEADFAETVRAYTAGLSGADTAQRPTILRLGTTYAFHTLRTRVASDTASAFPLFRFQSFFALGDSMRARRALAEYEAWGDSTADDFYDAHEMFSAESHLELGDTAAAWKGIEPFGRRWAGYNLTYSYGYLESVRGAGRAWLLYADLAMATGHRDEARRGYKMIVGMWERGDPPVQPLVKRAKDALAKLGGP